MNQKKEPIPQQVEYLGRWVDKKHFRAFVYGANGAQQLAESYEEYEKLVSSGAWSAQPIKELPKVEAKEPEQAPKEEEKAPLSEVKASSKPQNNRESTKNKLQSAVNLGS